MAKIDRRTFLGFLGSAALTATLPKSTTTSSRPPRRGPPPRAERRST